MDIDKSKVLEMTKKDKFEHIKYAYIIKDEKPSPDTLGTLGVGNTILNTNNKAQIWSLEYKLFCNFVFDDFVMNPKIIYFIACLF